MKKIFYFFTVSIFLFSGQSSAQFQGFTDRFEDGSFEILRKGRSRDLPPHIVWQTLTPLTYGMEESGGMLTIRYTKEKNVGVFDHFTLTPPVPVDVNRNPHIQLRMKSTVDLKLTLQPVYSLKPPTHEEITHQIPGDNEWHIHTFRLYDYLYERFNVQHVDFYFDKGLNVEKDGTVIFDYVRVGWYLIEIMDLKADVQEGTDVRLSWTTNDPENAGRFRIYRGTEPRFDVSEDLFIGESETNGFIDREPGTYEQHFYRVVPIGKDGEVYLPSKDIRVETWPAGISPKVSVTKTSQGVVKKYEKYELELDLEDVGIFNPYDPDDIDVYALFRSPDNRSIRINAFYDNYADTDTWKLRFSPDVTGEWSCEVFVRDAGGTGKTDPVAFRVIESDHHGWIRPSGVNPHYFAHDDGTSYYAVGVYSPWRNTQERFRKFSEHKANLFAIWDIMYGGFVNETGIIEEELGRYNQEKLGRIDSLLVILEQHDIQLMYAIWPHDLFSKTVWAAQWEQNPYREIVDVVDVYGDDLTWEYQKKKYRYLIARFAHSRSMGIWELINEMNGTDGWKEARFEDAYEWVKKANVYFRENDPYQHPMTASFSGGYGEYREPLYERIDIPNLHVYPAQGWPVKYPGDTLRSSMYNYAWAARRFWDNFEKPAIFGEAGADLAYYDNDEPEYHEAYHNAIWAALTNGLAGIPVWWEYNHLNEQDWDHLSYLAEFVSDIDFANRKYAPAEISGHGMDVYFMRSEKEGFGWARSFEKPDIGNARLDMNMPDGKYRIKWFDTWEGKIIEMAEVKSGQGILQIAIPGLPEPRKDIAFIIDRLN
jgi:hypothetical protein